MLDRRSSVRLLACAVVALVVVAACSSSDDDGDGVTSFTGQAPDEIVAPPAEGEGVYAPQPNSPLPDGYVEEEFFVAGTATSFEAEDERVDGHWDATPGEEADYRTRVIVRRPASAEDFSGTVIVEWFNVSAIEASPDWAFMSEEMGREGHAYIGVSAQRQGVEGGDTLLEVGDVDTEAVAESGVMPDASGLKNIDPERYGTLEHPGDAYAFDIYSQVGRAAAASDDALLGGLEATSVIAVGESQSASFLATLVNAVHPLDPVFDGFLIHSRGGGVAPIDGDLVAARSGDNAEAFLSSGVQIRTDLDVPVFIFQTESDVTLLGFANARQPDTDLVRTWEVAGLSHADAHFIRAIIGGPRDPSVGTLLDCTEPINTGPQHEVIQAGLHHLVGWVEGGDPPPAGTVIELTDDEEITIARDEDGIAIGGVRHPMVDVPIATISGDPPGGATIEDLQDSEQGICLLFGTTVPFDPARLVELYGTGDEYVAAFRASADETVAAGFLLQVDADALVAEAEEAAATQFGSP